MSDETTNELIKKALILETQERTQFLNQLEEGATKQKIELLLNDDIELTNFIVQTSHGATALENHQIKDLQTGDKIKQFIIVKLIAKGGMGSVYLAYDDKLKRNVAIKTIRSEFIKNQATQQRFKQEAQILSQINHPSICQIYDYIDYGDGGVLVLELVDGITLSHIDLSESEKLDVFIQIASALVAAHDKDVIHRDLKPDNIMCTNEDKIKILDFGIAKSKVADDTITNKPIDNDNHHLTKMGTLMGTLLYMSPEQAEGKEITKASDIYSFGVIMQEMLTGVMVYDLFNTNDLKQQVIKAEKVNSDLVPNKYRNLIISLTQKNSTQRPSANEVLYSLRQVKELPKLRLKRFLIASVLIFLILGFSKYTYDLKQQTIKAGIARVEAEQAQIESEKVTEFLESLFKESDPYANNGETLTAKEMLEKGSIRVNQELAKQPRVLMRLNLIIAEIFTQKGEYNLAKTHFGKALKLFKSKQVVDSKLKVDYFLKQAKLHEELGHYDQMQATIEEAIVLIKQEKNLDKQYYFDAKLQLGSVYSKKSQVQKAQTEFDETLQFYQRDTQQNRYKIIENYNLQAEHLSNMGDKQKAVDYIEKALAMLEQNTDKDIELKLNLQGNISYMLSDIGKHHKAIEYGQSVINLRKRLLGENHQAVALAYDVIATIYMASGDVNKCIESNNNTALGHTLI